MPWPPPPFPALTRRAVRYRPVRGWGHPMPWPPPPFPALNMPGYGLFVREITARNNPFHQPSIVQFPREYRFHMARTS